MESKKKSYLNKSIEKQKLPNYTFKPQLNVRSVQIDEAKTPRKGDSVENRLIGFRDIYSKQKEDLQQQHLMN